jgi:hypothetical protein
MIARFLRSARSVRASLASAAMLALCAAGCAPQIGLGRADVLAPGTSRAALMADVTLLSPRIADGDPLQLPYALLVGSYHRGIAPKLELGGRAHLTGVPGFWLWGATFDLKWQPLDTGRWNGALVSSVGYHEIRLGGAPYWCPNLAIAWLTGYDLGAHQLVFGARFGSAIVDTDGQKLIPMTGLGLLLGLHFRVGRWDIPVELALTGSPLEFNGEVSTDSRRGAGFVSLGVGAGLRF